jgi:lipopolysaccharide export LptBFGC system permease protein LptF
MENRTALRGAGISKGLVVLFAVIVAIGLGVMAAFVAKTVTAPANATESPLVQSTYSGPGPDAQERNNHSGGISYADDKASTGHGQLP